MDAFNQENFEKQMLFLKEASMRQYHMKRKWLYISIAALILFSRLNQLVSRTTVLTLIIGELIVFAALSGTYLFFKPLACAKSKLYSSKLLFLLYFLSTSMLFFVMPLNFDTDNLTLHYVIIQTIVSICFGLIMGFTMFYGMKSNIDTFLKQQK